MKLIIDNPTGIAKSLAKNVRFKIHREKMISENASSMLYFADKSFVFGWYDMINSLLSSAMQENQNIAIKLPTKQVFADSFTPFRAMSLKSTKNTIEISTPGIFTATAMTLGSFALKSALKNEIQKLVKKYYNMSGKK